MIEKTQERATGGYDRVHPAACSGHPPAVSGLLLVLQRRLQMADAPEEEVAVITEVEKEVG